MENTCTGCLSSDRKLYSIGETGYYYHLYSQILNEIPVYDLSQVCVRVCWECRARLRGMQIFKQQVKRNYCDLMQHIPPQATSKLSSQMTHSISYPEITDDGPDVDSLKCEATIKEEHCELETFDSEPSLEQIEMEDIKEQPLQSKKTPKMKLDSSKLDVKKNRNKKTIQPESDIEECSVKQEIDIDDNRIDLYIEDIIDSSIDGNIDSYIEVMVPKIDNNVNEKLLKDNAHSKETKEKVTKISKRKLWNADAMKKAIQAVRSKEMGYRRAAKSFSVPLATLKDYVKKNEKSADSLVTAKMGRRPIFTEALEAELVAYCLEMEKNYYGVTPSDLKRMAFHLAKKNNIPNPFSDTKKKAGKKWMSLFMARHPELSFQTE